MSSNPVTVALADDHKAMRQALSYYLLSQPQLSVLFDVDNGVELLIELKKQQPDVVILDIKMPGINGIEALKIITENYPNVRILMLSAFFDEVYVAQCLQYGINGFLTKEMDVEDIYKAIKLAYNNEVYFTNLISNVLLKKYLTLYKKKDSISLPEFTEEEIRMLELLKEEKTADEISSIMNLSRRSIEIKRDKMREKSHTKTVGGLLMYAIKRGLIG